MLRCHAVCYISLGVSISFPISSLTPLASHQQGSAIRIYPHHSLNVWCKAVITSSLWDRGQGAHFIPCKYGLWCVINVIHHTVSYQPSTTKILNMINSCIPVSKLWRSPPSPIPRSPVCYTEYLNDNFPGNQYSESPPPKPIIYTDLCTRTCTTCNIITMGWVYQYKLLTCWCMRSLIG